MALFNLFPEQWQQMDTYLSKDHWFDNEGNAVYTTNYIDLYGEPDTGFPYYVVDGEPEFDFHKSESQGGQEITEGTAEVQDHSLTARQCGRSVEAWRTIRGSRRGAGRLSVTCSSLSPAGR